MFLCMITTLLIILSSGILKRLCEEVSLSWDLTFHADAFGPGALRDGSSPWPD